MVFVAMKYRQFLKVRKGKKQNKPLDLLDNLRVKLVVDTHLTPDKNLYYPAVIRSLNFFPFKWVTTPTLNFKSPNKILFNTCPNYYHPCTFGCACYPYFGPHKSTSISCSINKTQKSYFIYFNTPFYNTPYITFPILTFIILKYYNQPIKII